jgi:putative Ca2+/H+ antiporter (TMEM165/GDT1 family)
MNSPATAAGKVAAAWGDKSPAWVIALAAECDRTTAAATARRIGYSPALVSQVLACKYPGDLTAVEQAVSGALMAATVACPVVGELAADTCLAHQRAAWSPHNPQRIAFFRACRGGCANSRTGGGNAQ